VRVKHFLVFACCQRLAPHFFQPPVRWTNGSQVA
jgi:hypothetical protein